MGAESLPSHASIRSNKEPALAPSSRVAHQHQPSAILSLETRMWKLPRLHAGQGEMSGSPLEMVTPYSFLHCSFQSHEGYPPAPATDEVLEAWAPAQRRERQLSLVLYGKPCHLFLGYI